MGGLSVFLPFTYSCFSVGIFSLSGLPFLSGFYSKDFLINSSMSLPFSLSWWVGFVFINLGVFFTTYYSLRAFFYIFHSFCRMSWNSFLCIVESDWFISASIFFLGVLSIFIGFSLEHSFSFLGF